MVVITSLIYCLKPRTRCLELTELATWEVQTDGPLHLRILTITSSSESANWKCLNNFRILIAQHCFGPYRLSSAASLKIYGNYFVLIEFVSWQHTCSTKYSKVNFRLYTHIHFLVALRWRLWNPFLVMKAVHRRALHFQNCSLQKLKSSTTLMLHS